MNKFVKSKVSHPDHIKFYKDIKLNVNNIQKKIHFDGHIAVNPKYAGQGIGQLMMYYYNQVMHE